MNHVGKTLLLILLIQCGIVAALFWPQGPARQAMEPQALVSVQPSAIDEIRISDVPQMEAVLRRSGQRWILPELNDLPADPRSVQQLIDGLTGSRTGWPIAKSAAARQRFQVADYHHQRSVTLRTESGEATTIYLGTSPGYRKVHARNAASSEIYSLTFNVFDAPGNNAAWIDRKLLQIRLPLRISADQYSIHRTQGDWLTATGAIPDERELAALLSALRSLQVDGVASEAQQDALALVEAQLLLEIESMTGDINLGFFTLDAEHFVSSSEYPFFFKLSAFDFDRFTGIDFALLSVSGPKPHEEPAGDAKPALPEAQTTAPVVDTQ